MRIIFCLIFLIQGYVGATQLRTDTIPIAFDSIEPSMPDSSLRIINLNPYFTLHVDSTLSYQFRINRDADNYYWYVKNAPVGLRVNKDNGLLSFRAEKSYFLSGRLKYDQPYKVLIGVQNLENPKEKADTSFTLLFYSTEIIPSKVRPSIGNYLQVEEGENISFIVQCEDGSFPFEHITFNASRPLQNIKLVSHCNDIFEWTPSYDFVKETDSGRVKIVNLNFIGTTRFGARDTASIRIVVKDALNFPLAVQEYNVLRKNIETYILQLKYSFLQIDRKLKKNKSTRTTFDLSTATTSLTGTILNSMSSDDAQKAGKILPSVGLSLVPIKEAVASTKTVEQNQASQLRGSIKRLEYMLSDNVLVGEKDPDLLKKTNKLKEELKQTQVQLLDVPLELTSGMTEEQLNRYFNSKKVAKKYRLKK